jgi:hypothetical protein
MPRESIEFVFPDEATKVQTDLLLGRKDKAACRKSLSIAVIEKSVPHVYTYEQRLKNCFRTTHFHRVADFATTRRSGDIIFLELCNLLIIRCSAAISENR